MSIRIGALVLSALLVYRVRRGFRPTDYFRVFLIPRYIDVLFPREGSPLTRFLSRVPVRDPYEPYRWP